MMNINIVTCYDVAALTSEEISAFKTKLFELNSMNDNVITYTLDYEDDLRELMENVMYSCSDRPAVERVIHYYGEQVSFPDPSFEGKVKEVSFVNPSLEKVDLAIEVLVRVDN